MREIFTDKRVEIQHGIEQELRGLLAKDGIVLRSVFIGHVDLPAQYRAGLEGLLAEELATEKMRYTLELKEKQVAGDGAGGATPPRSSARRRPRPPRPRRSSPPRRARRR